MNIRFRIDAYLSFSVILQYIFYVLGSVVLAVLATKGCEYLSIDGQGSGIPDTKTVLAGINFYKIFSIRAMMARVLGLIFNSGAGLTTGFPMIAINAAIAENLLN
jgi:hypothetical protein